MKLITRVRFAAISLLLVLVAGCATGPDMKTMANSIPSMPAEQGRIWFFRSASPFGSAIQPSIMLNGKKVGDSVPGGFFFVDTAPGNYVVTTATETDYSVKFALDAAQERFIKTVVSMGVMVGRVAPELVDPEAARAAIQTKSYTGPKL